MKKIISLIVQVIAFIAPQLKKEDSKVGVKETKEALVAVNEVSVLMAKRFKDGVQFEDFSAFYDALTKDEDFKAKTKAGWEGAKAIPDEVKDLDIGEGLELAAVQLDYVPAIIDALKKDEIKA